VHFDEPDDIRVTCAGWLGIAGMTLARMSCPSASVGHPLPGNLIIQIFPLRVHLIDEPQLPCAIPLLQLFLARNCGQWCCSDFVPHQLMDIVLFGEALDGVGFVFPYAANEIICNADVECAVAFTGKDVDVELLWHSCYIVMPECFCRASSTRIGTYRWSTAGFPPKTCGNDAGATSGTT
jgi:hypothetical protein